MPTVQFELVVKMGANDDTGRLGGQTRCKVMAPDCDKSYTTQPTMRRHTAHKGGRRPDVRRADHQRLARRRWQREDVIAGDAKLLSTRDVREGRTPCLCVNGKGGSV